VLETSLHSHLLVPHPDSPPKRVTSVYCGLGWAGPCEWTVDFIIACPPDALRLPEEAQFDRTDGLWRTTCLELFVKSVDDPAYFEFNFSPSGQWAAYQFDAYRAGMRPLAVNRPSVRSADPDQFLKASIARNRDLGLDEATSQSLAQFGHQDQVAAWPTLEQFPVSVSFEDDRLAPAGPWSVGLSAVIEEIDGTKSYWALRHPPGPPDFHHPDCFALTLPAPERP